MQLDFDEEKGSTIHLKHPPHYTLISLIFIY